jgi:transcriptional regulator with XRE-family HTH domain
MRHSSILVVDGDAVRKLRDRAGWSTRAFAAIVGISEAFMGRIESGERQPSPAVRKRMAEALGVEVDAIAGYPDATEQNQDTAA